jgi:hypothetical protein
MAGDERMTQEEFRALSRLLAEGGQAASEDEACASLLEKRFVRRDREGWAVTVDGHLRYLKELAKTF